MPRYKHITFIVPALGERDNLPRLIECFRRQSLQCFSVTICINQPEAWRTLPADDYRHQFYLDNQQSLAYLNTLVYKPLTVIDRSSPNHGWTGKQQGVGMARRVLTESIAADDDEIIASLDADTIIGHNYVETLLDTFNTYPSTSALSLPYYHDLTGNDITDRSLLRYECYMRHYLLQLLLIGSRYAFTAIGSAMAYPLWALRRTGGYKPLQAGEDFYLMQQFAKTGRVLLPPHEALIVKPQGRTSRRVPFGTGPAVAMTLNELERHCPFYPPEAFDDIAATYALFPQLYHEDVETPMSAFLRQQLSTDNPWQPLRRNFRRQELFVRACAERVDGLRILQYLRQSAYRPESPLLQGTRINFATDPISRLEALRDSLFISEMQQRAQLYSSQYQQ